VAGGPELGKGWGGGGDKKSERACELHQCAGEGGGVGEAPAKRGNGAGRQGFEMLLLRAARAHPPRASPVRADCGGPRQGPPLSHAPNKKTTHATTGWLPATAAGGMLRRRASATGGGGGMAPPPELGRRGDTAALAGAGARGLADADRRGEAACAAAAALFILMPEGASCSWRRRGRRRDWNGVCAAHGWDGMDGRCVTQELKRKRDRRTTPAIPTRMRLPPCAQTTAWSFLGCLHAPAGPASSPHPPSTPFPKVVGLEQPEQQLLLLPSPPPAGPGKSRAVGQPTRLHARPASLPGTGERSAG
jgi:hypothetical protein